MVKPICLYGASVLRNRDVNISLDDIDVIRSIVTDLKDTLSKADGCGLAAPQIGLPYRILIVDGDVVSDTYDYLKGFKRTMINPVILTQSDKQSEYSEGCLSLPGIYADVKRPSEIEVEYYDENLDKISEKFDKFAARMIQHELDHLDGKMFIDHLPSIRKKMLTKKLLNISRGKVATRYKSTI